MKRTFLVIVVFIMVSVMVYAQTASPPTGSQIRQEAQQYLQQVRTNSSQFDSTLADQTSRDIDNKNMNTLNRLKAEIERLAASINTAQKSIDAELNRGFRANQSLVKRVQELLEQYKKKMAELEAFIEGIGAA
jgi:type VI protein secretion system component VasK